jgi:hypothetical protein
MRLAVFCTHGRCRRYGGTPWTDVIDAGAGSDLVLTRDSYTDNVSCSAGRDRVVADRKDAVAGDCERVQRA